MINVTFITADGAETAVSAGTGDTLMLAALSNGIPGIIADCGGALSCATCHVHIVPDWIERVGAPGEAETAMLEMAIDPDETSRLSCQVVLSDELDGLAVRIPPAQF